MVWGAIAGAAIGAVGSAIGSKSASDASDRASKRAEALSREQLEWEKEQYNEWKETYGDIEDNLADYYTNLTPELRTVQGLEAYEKKKNLAMDKLNENFAQRGISRSGIAAQTDTTFAIESAAERARIRAEAPMETAREQLAFLQVGLGQDPAGGVSGALSGRASEASQVARDTANAAGSATAAMWQAGTNLAVQAGETYDQYKRDQEAG